MSMGVRTGSSAESVDAGACADVDADAGDGAVLAVKTVNWALGQPHQNDPETDCPTHAAVNQLDLQIKCFN